MGLSCLEEPWYESGSPGEGVPLRSSLFVIPRSGRFSQEGPALPAQPARAIVAVSSRLAVAYGIIPIVARFTILIRLRDRFLSWNMASFFQIL